MVLYAVICLFDSIISNIVEEPKQCYEQGYEKTILFADSCWYFMCILFFVFSIWMQCGTTIAVTSTVALPAGRMVTTTDCRKTCPPLTLEKQ